MDFRRLLRCQLGDAVDCQRITDQRLVVIRGSCMPSPWRNLVYQSGPCLFDVQPRVAPVASQAALFFAITCSAPRGCRGRRRRSTGWRTMNRRLRLGPTEAHVGMQISRKQNRSPIRTPSGARHGRQNHTWADPLAGRGIEGCLPRRRGYRRLAKPAASPPTDMFIFIDAGSRPCSSLTPSTTS